MPIRRPLLAFTSCALLALAASAPRAQDAGKLPADEVKKTIAGKTAVYTAPNGSPQRVYYAADGQLTGRAGAVGGGGKSTQSMGTWTVEADGKICQAIKQGPMTDRCYYLMRTDAGLAIGQGSGKGIAITLE